MPPWFSFWDIGAAVVKSSKIEVMFNYCNAGVQREVRSLNSRSQMTFQGSPFVLDIIRIEMMSKS